MNHETLSDDVEFERILRSVMADRSEPVRPSAGWGLISDRLRKVRRRRRIRAGAQVSAGLLAVTGVIGAVNGLGSAAPDQPNQHTPATAGTGAVRGSLRSNQAWLTALRRHVSATNDVEISNSPALVDGLGQWSPPKPDQVRVVFAGDLNGYRVALVTGPWRSVNTTAVPQGAQLDLRRWFVGRAGAAVKDLQPGSGSPITGSSTAATQTVQPGSLSGSTAAMKATGLVVAVVDGPADVQLAGPASYSSDGRASLQRPVDIPAVEPGVYAAPVPADGAYRLVVDGQSSNPDVLTELRDFKPGPGLPANTKGMPSKVAVGLTDFSVPVSGIEPELPTGIEPARGGATPTWEVLRYAVGRAGLFSGLKAEDRSYQLISARPGYDAAGTVSEWTVVTAVTAPSGAHFVAVSEVLPGGHGVNEHDHALEAWKVVPSGSLDALAWAWPVTGAGPATVTPMGLISILGPRDAVSAEVLGPQGRVVGTVTVTGQVQAVDFDHQPLSKVRFLDRAGKTLTVVPVAPYAGGGARAPATSWPTSTG